MRRLGSVLLALVLLSVSTACGGTPAAETVTSPPVQEVKSEAQLAMEAILSRYDGTEERSEEQALLAEKIRLSAEGLQRVEEYLAASIPTYPYGELAQLEVAYKRYLALELPEGVTNFSVVSALPITDTELMEYVRANNDAFLAVPSIANSVFRPLDEEYFSWVCQVVTDTVNQELSGMDFGVQLASIRLEFGQPEDPPGKHLCQRLLSKRGADAGSPLRR